MEPYYVGYQQGFLQGLNTVLNFVETLEQYRIPTDEEKQEIAKKRNYSEPSQAEVMGMLNKVEKPN
jgi:hypothetical protein